MSSSTLRWLVVTLVLTVLVAGVRANETRPAPATQPVAATGPAPATRQADAKPFKAEELEQLVAPIALHPDSVLAQVFMASTYPIEVVQADRWVTEHPNLKGDALTAELEKHDWDPSIKSLVNFPQVLAMMSKQLEWTSKLGDAFIADQAAVMLAVQTLRAKAKAQGTLADSEQQKVIVEPAPQTVVVQGAAPPPQVIRIESPSPEVIYVPAYNPTVVYGAWPYPAYPPPPPYYPPGYVASNLISFGAGVAIGAAWGYAWGGCNWGHGDVDIDVNRNANINQNINRQQYQANLQNRTANRQPGTADRAAGTGRTSFQHDPAHRKGVSYRDQATASRLGGQGTNMDAARARESYRGRAEAGRQDIARGGADQFRGSGTPGRAGSPGQLPSNRGVSGGSRVGADSGRVGSTANRPSATPTRSPGTSQYRSSAFDGADRSGAAARTSSSRGQSSRSSMSRSAPSGGSRSFGGGGGGGRGGGRR